MNKPKQTARIIKEYTKILVKSVASFCSEWAELIKQIITRFVEPMSSPNFMLYFVFIVLGLGAVGPWHLLIAKYGSIEFYNSLSTFSLALAAGCFAEVVLSTKHKKNLSEHHVPSTLSFPYVCLFLATASAAILGLVLVSSQAGNLYLDAGHHSAVTSLILSLIFWWQVNARNPQLSNNGLNPNDPLGDADKIDSKETDGYNV